MLFRSGAIGVNLGRNIWQNNHPVAMIRALRHIIHENGSVDEADQMFTSIKAGELSAVPMSV